MSMLVPYGFDVQVAVANSYRNFHARGLDYICLQRTPSLTRKLYILEGDASKVPEVVNPHDHRYRFHTEVLAGKMRDHRWTVTGDDDGEVFNAFDYHTPLNGGDGFTFRGEERLSKECVTEISAGGSLGTVATHIHTIQMMADQTVLLLTQFADEYPVEKPSSCWSKSSPSISDDGLYERFTEGQIIDRLRSLGIFGELHQ